MQFLEVVRDPRDGRDGERCVAQQGVGVHQGEQDVALVHGGLPVQTRDRDHWGVPGDLLGRAATEVREVVQPTERFGRHPLFQRSDVLGSGAVHTLWHLLVHRRGHPLDIVPGVAETEREKVLLLLVRAEIPWQAWGQ